VSDFDDFNDDDDKTEEYPCPMCNGDLSLYNGFWTCNNCDFKSRPREEVA